VASLEAPRWLAALDCLVLPSRTTAHWKEQFGRVLIEAMACGVPVVGSSSGAIPTVIGDAGRVFPEGDFAALGRELTALSLDGALRSELGGRGRAWVLASYSQGRIVAETVAFYRKLLGLRAAVAPAVSAAPPVAARGS
jgi:glycosyltransferase involved in cell wall biosynthesis